MAAIQSTNIKTVKSAVGFWSLVWTQFFGAINDNILKVLLVFMIIDGIWTGKLGGAEAQGYINILFTIPFVLLSGYAGRFADRNSKRNVILWVKIMELPIALVAAIGFWTQSLWLALAALVAVTCQSAYYGPAKYGIIPEIVETKQLSRANGLMNMMTNIAVIIGTLMAGQIADYYAPGAKALAAGAHSAYWLPGLAMIIVACAGVAAAFFIPRVPAGDKSVQYEWNPISTYVGSLKEMSGTPLFTVMFAWAYFYFLAGLALMVLPEYVTVLKPFGVSKAEVSVLMGVLGVAIGIGCLLAGYMSGNAIRPRLVPWGGVGMSLFFALLGLVPTTLPNYSPYWRVLLSPTALFILGAGISAGFYIVPLQALMQRLTPRNELGRFLGTANGLSFVFILISAAIYPLMRPLFAFEDGTEYPEKIFIVAAIAMAFGVLFFVWRVRARGFSLKKVE